MRWHNSRRRAMWQRLAAALTLAREQSSRAVWRARWHSSPSTYIYSAGGGGGGGGRNLCAMTALSAHIIGYDTQCCEDSQLRVHNADVLAKNISSAHDCWEACTQAPSCLFFSHLSRYHLCELCSGCRLMRYRTGFISYSRQAAARFVEKDVAARSQLGELLQGNYSVRLYGRLGRVPADLRLIWAYLLPPRALDAIRAASVCKTNSDPPHRPFCKSAAAGPPAIGSCAAIGLGCALRAAVGSCAAAARFWA